mmetsp:Transcript_12140/g.23675  ORF Transcript_12140/g.23675 Transcript_12140/m.23675 type:complete len:111 (+) Transcript_12140:630-962(+)
MNDPSLKLQLLASSNSPVSSSNHIFEVQNFISKKSPNFDPSLRKVIIEEYAKTSTQQGSFFSTLNQAAIEESVPNSTLAIARILDVVQLRSLFMNHFEYPIPSPPVLYAS